MVTRANDEPTMRALPAPAFRKSTSRFFPTLTVLAALLVPVTAAEDAASSQPIRDLGLASTIGRVAILEQRDLGDGMMFARLADGTWVVGPHGTVVETRHISATAVVDGRVRGGMLTEVLARPPAAFETVRSGPASRKHPWEYAVQAGVMTPQAASAAAAALSQDEGAGPVSRAFESQPRMLSAGFQAQQTSAQVTAAMGQYMYGGCAGADNETGFVHGCYERYRGKNYHYSTPSWATGHHRSSWILTRVRTGTRYARSNPGPATGGPSNSRLGVAART